MRNNVLAMPINRPAGRRRVRPVPDAPLADVFGLDARRSAPPLTPDERIAELEGVIGEVSRALMLAISAITSRSR